MKVLRLVANGLSEREVADKLFISPHTAHRHLSNIRFADWNPKVSCQHAETTEVF